jgi:glucokinase
MVDLAQGKIEAVTTEIVGQAIAAGDPLALEVLQETIELLTAWLGNIVDLFDPDVVVMGGGVAAMLRPFLNSRCSEIPLLMAHYGADAGIAGGAALCSNTET